LHFLAGTLPYGLLIARTASRSANILISTYPPSAETVIFKMLHAERNEYDLNVPKTIDIVLPSGQKKGPGAGLEEAASASQGKARGTLGGLSFRGMLVENQDKWTPPHVATAVRHRLSARHFPSRDDLGSMHLSIRRS